MKQALATKILDWIERNTLAISTDEWFVGIDKDEFKKFILSISTKDALCETFFRLGKKQGRAVLDAGGKEVVLFPVGMEGEAQEYCDFLNSKTVEKEENPWISVKDKL